MSDILSISNLEVACIVGVYSHERDRPQPLIVDVDMWLDTRAAALSDSLGDALDYARVAAELRGILETARFRLLESAAEALARALLAHATIERVRVKLTKPEALGNGALASLTIERARGDDALEPGA